MSNAPKLAYTVHVRGREYAGGTTPPVEIGKTITNRSAWEGGEVPDWSGARDTKDTQQGGALTGASNVPGLIGGNNAIPKADDEENADRVYPEASEHDGGPGLSSTDPELATEPRYEPIVPVPAPADDEDDKPVAKPRARKATAPKAS